MQVSSTKGIAVGQWVRLWVQQPSRPVFSRRALLGRQEQTQAPGSHRQLLQAGGNASSSGAAAPARAYLPLSNAAAAAVFSAASQALSEREEDVSLAASHRPTVASAGGTLDAHLYGENAVDSGSGERAGQRRAATCFCVKA